MTNIVGGRQEDQGLPAPLRGLPPYYDVLPAGSQWGVTEMRVHYSRVIRAVGFELPLGWLPAVLAVSAQRGALEA
jgi:hypothetical protein